ncbi:ependymin-like [Conger conger]|uniref:ependymin-like n=1 Tax=Conger conger TaxID=82655 RepID=UPI002A5A36AC|nr:ependymin-like [Conger conger]
MQNRNCLDGICFIWNKMDARGDLMVNGKYRYDALGKKVRFHQMGSYQNKTISTDLLMLFNEKVMYKINWSRLSCKKMGLRVPFQPLEVPRDAFLAGQTILGSASAFGQGLLVNTWMGEDREFNAKYMSVFTGIGCLPVTSMYHTDSTGWVMLSYYNIMLGIDNPHFFHPPIFCQNAVLEGTTDYFEALRLEDELED